VRTLLVRHSEHFQRSDNVEETNPLERYDNHPTRPGGSAHHSTIFEPALARSNGYTAEFAAR
jgi:hypothetical protein